MAANGLGEVAHGDLGLRPCLGSEVDIDRRDPRRQHRCRRWPDGGHGGGHGPQRRLHRRLAERPGQQREADVECGVGQQQLGGHGDLVGAGHAGHVRRIGLLALEQLALGRVREPVKEQRGGLRFVDPVFRQRAHQGRHHQRRRQRGARRRHRWPRRPGAGGRHHPRHHGRRGCLLPKDELGLTGRGRCGRCRGRRCPDHVAEEVSLGIAHGWSPGMAACRAAHRRPARTRRRGRRG